MWIDIDKSDLQKATLGDLKSMIRKLVLSEKNAPLDCEISFKEATNETTSLLDYLISKEPHMSGRDRYEIDIVIKTTTEPFETERSVTVDCELIPSRLRYEVCNSFLSLQDKVYELNIRSNEYNFFSSFLINPPGFINLFPFQDVARYHSPRLNKLAYIFNTLGIPVFRYAREVGMPPTTDEHINRVNARDDTIWKSHVLEIYAAGAFKLAHGFGPIQKLCGQYLGHTWEVRRKNEHPFREQELTRKEDIIRQLYYASPEHARDILSKEENKRILNRHRTPWSHQILNSLLVLVTLPVSIPFLVYSGVKRGSLNFFKTDSQVLVDKINKQLPFEPSPAHNQPI